MVVRLLRTSAPLGLSMWVCRVGHRRVGFQGFSRGVPVSRLSADRLSAEACADRCAYSAVGAVRFLLPNVFD
jgi:hypothetical protein